MDAFTTNVMLVTSSGCSDQSKVLAIYMPNEEAFIYNGEIVPLHKFFNDRFTGKGSDDEEFKAYLKIDEFRWLYEEAVDQVQPIFEEGDTVWKKTYANGRYKYITYLVGPIVGYRKETCSIHSDRPASVVALREFTNTANDQMVVKPEQDMKPMGDLKNFKLLSTVIARITKELKAEGVKGIQVAAAGDLYTL